MADEFQASRGPVGEALRILEREGFAQLHARRDARASLLSRQGGFDLFEIRSHLCEAIAHRIAAKPSTRIVTLLEPSVRTLHRHAELPDDGSLYAMTVFHLSQDCARAAGNPRLGDMITSLSLQTYCYSRLGLSTRLRRRQSATLWPKALDAVRRGNVAAATEIVRRGILESRTEALRFLCSDNIGTNGRLLDFVKSGRFTARPTTTRLAPMSPQKTLGTRRHVSRRSNVPDDRIGADSRIGQPATRTFCTGGKPAGMSKASSPQLRQQVVTAVRDEALSHRTAAIRFTVTAASIRRWRVLEHQSGKSRPDALGGRSTRPGR